MGGGLRTSLRKVEPKKAANLKFFPPFGSLFSSRCVPRRAAAPHEAVSSAPPCRNRRRWKKALSPRRHPNPSPRRAGEFGRFMRGTVEAHVSLESGQQRKVRENKTLALLTKSEEWSKNYSAKANKAAKEQNQCAAALKKAEERSSRKHSLLRRRRKRSTKRPRSIQRKCERSCAKPYRRRSNRGQHPLPSRWRRTSCWPTRVKSWRVED